MEEKIVIIKDSCSDLVVSFPCRDINCYNCSFRFRCYTIREGLDLDCRDIDEKLSKLPRELYDDFFGIPDDEFYHKAFKLVATLGHCS